MCIVEFIFARACCSRRDNDSSWGEQGQGVRNREMSWKMKGAGLTERKSVLPDEHDERGVYYSYMPVECRADLTGQDVSIYFHRVPMSN